MGRRGPPPKPTKLKVLSGNPGKRRLNTREPRPKKGVPRCPDWLSPEAKKAWRWVTEELHRMGLLTLADKHALTAYCQVYGRWKAAEEFIQKHGDVFPIRDEHGRVKYMAQFPQVSIAKSLLQILRNYQQELGLTPSSRSGIEVEKPPEERACWLPPELQYGRYRPA